MSNAEQSIMVDDLRAVSIQVAASEYGVSQVTLYRLLRQGKLKRYEREGSRRTWLDRDQLEELFQYREKRSKDPQE